MGPDPHRTSEVVMPEPVTLSGWCNEEVHALCPFVLHLGAQEALCTCHCHIGGVREPRLDPDEPPVLAAALPLAST